MKCETSNGKRLSKINVGDKNVITMRIDCQMRIVIFFINELYNFSNGSKMNHKEQAEQKEYHKDHGQSGKR